MEAEFDGNECQIFLSHSGHQKHIVEDLFNQLKKILGDRSPSAIFFDRSVASIPMGAHIYNNIGAAIKSCKVGVLFISPDFLESEWPMRELELLVDRTLENKNPISLYPIFYNTRAINDTLKSEDSIVEKWGEKWKAFEEVHGVDVRKWARCVGDVKKMRGEILIPNDTVQDKIYNVAVKISDQLPPPLRPPLPLPAPPSQDLRNSALEIRRQPAHCQYSTSGSLFRADTHASFYMQPVGYNAPQTNHRPKDGLLGQQPKPGPHNDSATVETLLFADAEQARTTTRPIGAGNEWWELIWTDRGSFIHPNDHSCWRVRPEQIPQGFVCLSPCFFKIESFAQRMANSWIPRGFAGYNDGQVPPSNEDVQGMVAVREDLVTYVTGEQLIKLWDDRGSRATQNLAVYTGPGFSGCFAFDTYDPPMGGRYPILDRTRFR